MSKWKTLSKSTDNGCAGSTPSGECDWAERGWRAALRAGATVEVDIALAVDADDPFAPSFVVVTYWEDGDDYELPLLNEARAQ